MSIVTLRTVPREKAHALWPSVWFLLEPAMNRLGKRYDSYSVRRDVEDGRKHLWVAEVLRGEIVTAALTEIVVYEDHKSLNILAISGEGFGLWKEWIADLEVLARQMGCKMMEGLGRKGWEFILKGTDWRPVAVLYAKELD